MNARIARRGTLDIRPFGIQAGRVVACFTSAASRKDSTDYLRRFGLSGKETHIVMYVCPIAFYLKVVFAWSLSPLVFTRHNHFFAPSFS